MNEIIIKKNLQTINGVMLAFSVQIIQNQWPSCKVHGPYSRTSYDIL